MQNGDDVEVNVRTDAIRRLVDIYIENLRLGDEQSRLEGNLFHSRDDIIVFVANNLGITVSPKEMKEIKRRIVYRKSNESTEEGVLKRVKTVVGNPVPPLKIENIITQEPWRARYFPLISIIYTGFFPRPGNYSHIAHELVHYFIDTKNSPLRNNTLEEGLATAIGYDVLGIERGPHRKYSDALTLLKLALGYIISDEISGTDEDNVPEDLLDKKNLLDKTNKILEEIVKRSGVNLTEEPYKMNLPHISRFQYDESRYPIGFAAIQLFRKRLGEAAYREVFNKGPDILNDGEKTILGYVFGPEHTLQFFRSFIW